MSLADEFTMPNRMLSGYGGNTPFVIWVFNMQTNSCFVPSKPGCVLLHGQFGLRNSLSLLAALDRFGFFQGRCFCACPVLLT